MMNAWLSKLQPSTALVALRASGGDRMTKPQQRQDRLTEEKALSPTLRCNYTYEIATIALATRDAYPGFIFLQSFSLDEALYLAPYAHRTPPSRIKANLVGV